MVRKQPQTATLASTAVVKAEIIWVSPFKIWLFAYNGYTYYKLFLSIRDKNLICLNYFTHLVSAKRLRSDELNK